MHSSQGMLLSGSPPGGGGVGDGDGTATAVEKALWGAIPRPRLSGGKKLQEEEEEDGGHILLAPGVGSGVGIGPGFSSRDLTETSSGAALAYRACASKHQVRVLRTAPANSACLL